MQEPSAGNIEKMWAYARKYAEKSGTSLHPDRAVTETVVTGLARHIEQVGKPLSVQLLSGSGRGGEAAPLDLRVRRDAEVQVLPLSPIREIRRPADHRVPARRSRGTGRVRNPQGRASGQGPRDGEGPRPAPGRAAARLGVRSRRGASRRGPSGRRSSTGRTACPSVDFRTGHSRSRSTAGRTRPAP